MIKKLICDKCPLNINFTKQLKHVCDAIKDFISMQIKWYARFHLCPVVTYDLGTAISEGMDVATQLAFEMELVGNLSY